ncbi:MAG: L-lactate permease [Patescibacteria group bacterium]|nr:L-lactate permease [Patescibacteria group bacterium]MCL5261863.1 L-lactate permease [Patescibacteria group bacterium]
MNLAFALSISPFVLFLVLLLWRKLPLLKVSSWTLVLMAGLSVLYWRILPGLFFASFAKGFFVALDIFFIILGAIFFLEVLKDLKVIENISRYLESFSKDYRIQVIILAWFFENFLEGTAGFGTASAIVAPLLVGLGFAPLQAVIVSLLGNSTSVVFGAAGAPIRVGFAGLDYAAVPQFASWINCVGIIVPVFMLLAITAGKADRAKQIKEALPFAVWSGLAFVIPSALVVPLGQEFPSIIGSLIGLALVLLTTKLGLLVPKNIRRGAAVGLPAEKQSYFKLVFPYGLLIVLLILGKLLIGPASFSIPFALGHKFSLFNPGFAFLAAGLPIAIVWGSRRHRIAGEAIKKSLKDALGPFLVIASISVVVQLMINSGLNSSGLPSATNLIAGSFETRALPFWLPLSALSDVFSPEAPRSPI